MVMIQPSKYKSLGSIRYLRSICCSFTYSPSLPDPWSCSHLYPLSIVEIFLGQLSVLSIWWYICRLRKISTGWWFSVFASLSGFAWSQAWNSRKSGGNRIIQLTRASQYVLIKSLFVNKVQETTSFCVGMTWQNTFPARERLAGCSLPGRKFWTCSAVCDSYLFNNQRWFSIKKSQQITEAKANPKVALLN